jgi:acetyl-CoA carboxylase biotin carboxyl carrier protein
VDAREYLQREFDALLDVLRTSDVEEFEVQHGELSVRLHRTRNRVEDSVTPPELVPQLEESHPRTQSVVSTLVGTFYRAGEPGSPPLVEEGSQVFDDTVVGIVEALGSLTEVRAGFRGVVTHVLATDGHVVEYGQPLLEVAVDG